MILFLLHASKQCAQSDYLFNAQIGIHVRLITMPFYELHNYHTKLIIPSASFKIDCFTI